MAGSLNLLSECKSHTSITWNIRSLLPNIEEIIRLKIEANPESMFITETRLRNNIGDSEFLWRDITLVVSIEWLILGKKPDGGLLIYYKEKVNCVPLPELNLCTPDIETIWIKLKLCIQAPYRKLKHVPRQSRRTNKSTS